MNKLRIVLPVATIAIAGAITIPALAANDERTFSGTEPLSAWFYNTSWDPANTPILSVLDIDLSIHIRRRPTATVYAVG